MQGGAVIGGGGSNTYVLLNGQQVDRSANKINFSGDNISVTKGAQGTVDVSVNDAQGGVTGFVVETDTYSDVTTQNSFDFTQDTFKVESTSPALILQSLKADNVYHVQIGLSKITSSPGSWSQSNATNLAHEGNLADLYTEIYTKEEDMNMNGKNILNSTIDGGTF
jgi:hypothetical protein